MVTVRQWKRLAPALSSPGVIRPGVGINMDTDDVTHQRVAAG